MNIKQKSKIDLSIILIIVCFFFISSKQTFVSAKKTKKNTIKEIEIETEDTIEATATVESNTDFLFRDDTLPLETRVNDVLSRLTLNEKIRMIGGYTYRFTQPIERLNIPYFEMQDGPLGVAGWGWSGRATSFPSPLGIAATFDPSLGESMGKAFADEWRSRGMHIYLGPGMNMYRSSRCGRNFEYWGEDPFLTTKLTTSFIINLQKHGVMAVAKHYVANEQEFNRFLISSEVSKRALHEIYLMPFKSAIEKGNVMALMSGYNPVNGKANTANEYLLDVLKKDWNFEGLFMSDWGATYETLEPAVNGLDLEMPLPSFFSEDKIMDLLTSGDLNIDDLDDKVKRIFRAIISMKFLDREQKLSDIPKYNPETIKLSKDVSSESMVLLKNVAEILPLNKKSFKKIAVIGPTAEPSNLLDQRHDYQTITYGGGGSSQVNAWHSTSFLQGIENYLEDEDEVAVYYDEGISNRFLDDVFSGKYAQVNMFPSLKDMKIEFFDNKDFMEPPVMTDLDSNSINMGASNSFLFDSVGDFKSVSITCTVTPEEVGKITFVLRSQGGYIFSINDEIVADTSDSTSYASSMIDFDVEKKNIPIKLDLKYIKSVSIPEMRMGWFKTIDFKETSAVKLAEESDLVIFCAGRDNFIDIENRDHGYDLPYGQDELISAVVAKNPNTVVLLTAGGGADMSTWIDDVPALLYTWYPGMDGGKVAAKILFGDINPSGKLPISIERKWEDSPVYGNYDEKRGNGEVVYSEDIFLGYKWYDAFEDDEETAQALFPFGYGLSYTSFEYSNLEVSEREVSFTIKNTGLVAGKESAQLYISSPNKLRFIDFLRKSFRHKKTDDTERKAKKEEFFKTKRPVKELKGFDKVTLEPGEEKIVTIPVNEELFSFFDVEEEVWVAGKGTFDILVGSSSKDIKLTGEIKL